MRAAYTRDMSDPATLCACPCCGLVHRLPDVARAALRCTRCHTRLRAPRGRAQATAALALAALILLPLAVTLPVLRVEKLGAAHESSILGGGVTLIREGQAVVGVVVLLCSVVLPTAKLAALFVLSAGARALGSRGKARTWHLVEWTGRWGMLDVLLVALLVATLKLGDLVEIHAGLGALAFTVCVVLNLAASAAFNPHDLWTRAR